MQLIHASNGGSVDAHVYYKFVIKENDSSVQCYVHKLMSMRMNICMETFHGTSVDNSNNNNNSIYLYSAIYPELKSCSEALITTSACL